MYLGLFLQIIELVPFLYPAVSAFQDVGAIVTGFLSYRE
jgi:hypothetical protein